MDHIHNCQDAPYLCISHVVRSRIPNLAALADTFTVSDATFASGDTESFGAHVTVSAGTIDGFVGYNPVQSKTGEKPGKGYGMPEQERCVVGAGR